MPDCTERVAHLRGRPVAPSRQFAPNAGHIVAVVIPAYRVRSHIVGVLAGIGSEVEQIYVVDDACPQATGEFVQTQYADSRVRVVQNCRNRGVGGAVIAGYQAAVRNGATILIKLDGDGQMDPSQIPRLMAPILRGEADYCKGNRFYYLTHIRRMPAVRIFGNAILSFLTKLSTGYWDIFDPTNGFTALHASIVHLLDWPRINERYFFESDLLHHLGLVRARVKDVPMHARYGTEESNLRISRILFLFLRGHVRNTCRRILYSYFLRDFSAASLEILLGPILVLFGGVVGGWNWHDAVRAGQSAYAGTVMLAALPIILGMQMLLAFVAYDVMRVPRETLHASIDAQLLADNVGASDAG